MGDKRQYRSPLRAEQATATAQRIVEAAAALVAENGSLDVSMTQVARRARVSEPTVYRHFPNKGALFQALAAMQFRTVTEGVEPRAPHELRGAARRVFRRTDELEPLIRWTLATPLARSTPRLHRSDRLGMLRAALA